MSYEENMKKELFVEQLRLMADNADLVDRLADCEVVRVEDVKGNPDVISMLDFNLLREKDGELLLGNHVEKYIRGLEKTSKIDKHYKICDTDFPYEGK